MTARWVAVAAVGLLGFATRAAADVAAAQAPPPVPPVLLAAPVPLAAPGQGIAQAAERPTLAALRDRYGPTLYRGLVQLRANKQAGEEHLVGDNTDAAGMHWTKITNVALDLVATLVAVVERTIGADEGREHVRVVLGALGALDSYHGIFSEALRIEGKLESERTGGQLRYSSIDAAWSTLALGLLESYYRASVPELAAAAGRLLSAQDYAPFVGPDGLLLGGLVVDAGSGRVIRSYDFSYADLNSEARPLIAALVFMGKLPRSAWDRLGYRWALREGVRLAQGWHQSAFVELSGELLFDEMALAPLSLGFSHRQYVEASRRLARREGHRFWGYAPTGSPSGGYTEYGLDRPDVVSPYGAALLALSADPGAVQNLSRVLALLPADGRPAPDGLDPRTGQVLCPHARSLDQSLLYLALHAETLRALARRSDWYAPAEDALRALDARHQPPTLAAPAGTAPPSPDSSRPAGTSAPATPAGVGPPPALPAPAPAPVAPANGSLLVPQDVRDTLRAAGLGAERSQSSAGGSIELAARRADRTSALATRAWLDVLPDVAISLRHESWRGVDVPGARPSWWAEGEARISVSLDKLETALAAERDDTLARLGVRAAERSAFFGGLRAELRLHLAERRLAELESERGATLALRRGLPEPPRVDADAALLDARLAALDVEWTAADTEARAALVAWLELSQEPHARSGLDPKLSLGELLVAIESETRERPALDEPLAAARVALEAERLSGARAASFPELRARAFASLPHEGDATGDAGWNLDRVTGELTLALIWRPEGRLLEQAAAASLERAEQQERDTHSARVEALGSARAHLDASSRAASDPRGKQAAEALANDRVLRFRRGELDARAVLDARALRHASATLDAQSFAQASLAALDLAEATPAPDALAASARAAGAEARRAEVAARAAAAADCRATFEAGLLGPLYQRAGAAELDSVGALVGGPRALGRQPADDLGFVARAALEVRLGDRESAAARAEAELRAAELALAERRSLAEQARARVELAYAREALALAERRASVCTEQRAALAAMQAQGLLADASLTWQAELRAAAADAQRERARAARQSARLRLERVLAGAAERAEELVLRAPDEAPESLEAWLASSYYPGHGLLGYAGELPPAVAKLELRSAEARLAALSAPPASVALSLQATHSFETSAASWGLGIGFNLDPTTRPPRVLEAAERVAALGGALLQARRAAELERNEAQRAYAAASSAHRLEAEQRERLIGVLGDLLAAQAVDVTEHPSSKLRARGELTQRLLDADERRLDARRKLALTHLRQLELGPPARTPPLPALAAAGASPLESARTRLIETDLAFASANAAARAVVEAPGRPPLLAGLHPLGPALGVAHVVQPVPDAAITSRSIQGSVGAGLQFALDEGLSFLARPAREDAVGLAARAEWVRSERDAFAAIGLTWRARQRRRLLSSEEQSARQRLESVVLPRYRAGHIPPVMLADAQRAHGDLLAELRRAESEEQSLAAELAARGVPIGADLDAVLDEYASCSLGGDRTEAAARLARAEQQPSPAALALSRRSDVARGEAWLDLARGVGPLSWFLELAPQGETIDEPLGSSWDRRYAFLSSLILPVAFDAVAESAATRAAAAVLASERAAADRLHLGSVRALRERLAASEASEHAARERLAAAARALEQVGSLYRNGTGRTTIDQLFSARDERFMAERDELEAHADWLASCSALQRL
jgi:hypothetical protein